MENDCNRPQPRILLITTLLCSYPGADTAGQMHQEYTPNTFVLRAPAPIVFPEDFYLRAFEKGIDGIIIMSAGSDCPYIGAYDRMAKRIPRVYEKMKQKGLDVKRLKLTAICSVCTKAFLKEINSMVEVLNELGPIDREKSGELPESSGV
jgi:F420-non-reducing hydrogenase iron-sulfur subunit